MYIKSEKDEITFTFIPHNDIDENIIGDYIIMDGKELVDVDDGQSLKDILNKYQIKKYTVYK